MRFRELRQLVVDDGWYPVARNAGCKLVPKFKALCDKLRM